MGDAYSDLDGSANYRYILSLEDEIIEKAKRFIDNYPEFRGDLFFKLEGVFKKKGEYKI